MNWLVVSNIFYVPFHIWDVILPIDELHHFSRWLLHHQPVNFLTRIIQSSDCDGRFSATLDHWRCFPAATRCNWRSHGVMCKRLLDGCHVGHQLSVENPGDQNIGAKKSTEHCSVTSWLWIVKYCELHIPLCLHPMLPTHHQATCSLFGLFGRVFEGNRPTGFGSPLISWSKKPHLTVYILW
jgi:hypothetical protein